MESVIDNVLQFILDWPIPILLGLAYFAGLLISIILLARSKSKAAILAAVAFGVLLLKHTFASPIARVIADVLDSHLGYTIVGAYQCCCGVLQLAAVICLVIAIQQAISPSIPKEIRK